MKRLMTLSMFVMATGCEDSHTEMCSAALKAQHADIRAFKASKGDFTLHSRIMRRQEKIEMFCAAEPMEDL